MTRPPCDEWVPGNDAGTYTTPVDKVLIHTTEGTSIAGSVASYRANNSWPHLTVDCRHGRVPWRVGHLDLDVPARALRNESGGVETNRDGVIQIEVVGAASRPAEIDWVWLGAHVVGPICAATGVPVSSTVPWAAYPASYGKAAPQRLSPDAWTVYRGVLGHQHVPENSHGDPGAIPIAVVLTAALPPQPVPQEDDMPVPVRVIYVPGDPDGRDDYMAVGEGYAEKFRGDTPEAHKLAVERYEVGLKLGMLTRPEPVDKREYDVAEDLARRLAPPKV